MNTDSALKKYICIFSLLLLLAFAHGQIYLDPNASIDDRVDDLLSRMSLADKIGQMTQAERGSINANPELISSLRLGSILSGGGSVPFSNTTEGWADMYDAYQAYTEDTPLQIPLLYGVDAVHGHNNLENAVIFPHNIGLGCTQNPQLVEECARITALEVSATGIDWTFSPCVAVPRDERWGRTYEGFAETPELVEIYSKFEVLGYQTDSLGKEHSILACAKHFIADGGTTDGINTGNANITEEELREIHLPGYISSIDAGVVTVMASFSSWNNSDCHGDSYLLTDLLKNELGFNGFIISDWNGISHLNTDYSFAVKQAINAGIDMAMVPYNYEDFISTLTTLVDSGEVSMERIDDAVRRILRVKFQSGLFENKYTDRSLFDTVGCSSHRQVARQAVRESLVLLKNNGVLPLSKTGTKILVLGNKADDIGVQCGGWTITWQGASGNITEGTTILEAIREIQGGENVEYMITAPVTYDADIAIVVVGEMPYAESNGDDPALSLSDADKDLVSNIHNLGIPFVTILLSGRPMMIDDELDYSDAFIAAWLPGTEGKGITDVLYGDYDFTGKLSHTWPESISQVPINQGDVPYSPLFPYGYGLSYQSTAIRDEYTDEKTNLFRISPNPASDYCTLSNLPNETVSIEIISLTGKVMLEKKISNTTREVLPIDGIEEGLYFVRVRSEHSGMQGQKLVVLY